MDETLLFFKYSPIIEKNGGISGDYLIFKLKMWMLIFILRWNFKINSALSVSMKCKNVLVSVNLADTQALEQSIIIYLNIITSYDNSIWILNV